ncbi:MAG: transcriptional repressor [Bacteroidales bacterium]|nr:transcriptional repressor [Bacteroidales bacterium]
MIYDFEEFTPKEMLDKYLTTNKMRRTPERFMILEEIYKIDGHFDIEWLYKHISDLGHNVSKATIYNTMEVLTACGLVIRHDFDTARASYERNLGKGHNHVVCVNCGKVAEFDDMEIPQIEDNAAAVTNFEIYSHRVYLYGLCPQCATKKLSR